MTDFAEEAKQLWNAAYFLRRAPERDQAMAVRVLRSLTGSSRDVIAWKARQALSEYENSQQPA